MQAFALIRRLVRRPLRRSFIGRKSAMISSCDNDLITTVQIPCRSRITGIRPKIKCIMAELVVHLKRAISSFLKSESQEHLKVGELKWSI